MRLEQETREDDTAEIFLLDLSGERSRYSVRFNSPWPGYNIMERLSPTEERAIAISLSYATAVRLAERYHTGREPRPPTIPELRAARVLAEALWCRLDNDEQVVAALVEAGVRPSSVAAGWDEMLRIARHLRPQVCNREGETCRI